MKRTRPGKKRAARPAALPHSDVYVRLAPSRIHGIGVFAIRRIPKGAAVFGADSGAMIWVDVAATARLPPGIKALYTDFCVQQGGRYGCPRSFNDITVAWYLNHSNRPNVTCGDDYRFVAARTIRAGEELTADYRTYSENPTPWRPRRRASVP